jgi:subtilisin family serine protease
LNRAFRVVVLLALVAGAAVGTGTASAERTLTARPLTPITTITQAKSFTARIAQSDLSLLQRTDSALVNVMIRLDYDPVASYFGGVTGLRPTSPEATGKSLAKNSAAVAAYTAHVKNVEASVVRGLQARVPGIKVYGHFRVAFGGVAAQLPANRVRELLSVPGVVAVMKDGLKHPQTSVTPKFLGATQVWKDNEGKVLTGQNVLVGVMDTGIWPEHDSFKDRGLPAFAGSFGCQYGDGIDPDFGPLFLCNDKIVGSYAFTDTYTSFQETLDGEYCQDPGPPTGSAKECSTRDADGHGTHTTSTAAGDNNKNAQIFGVKKGTISGMAPGARIIMYRVCLDAGCFFSDMVSAVEQVIEDGTDVLNVSIGPFGPPYSDAVALAFLDAFAGGTLVSVSAGNEGPGEGTSSDPGPWAITVGASTSPRFYESTLHVTASGGATFDAPGTTITAGIGSSTDIVDADTLPGYTDSLCQTPLPASVAGKIVACERGVNARVEKGYNVSVGGGAGMILYNTVANQDVETDNHWVPAIHLGGASDGIDFKAFLDSHSGEKATWAAGDKVPTTPDVMAAFSSRGPVGDWIKPDITAPGVQILAGHTPTPVTVLGGPPGQYYQAIAGTSMSSPHSAGLAALVKAVHPDWTPAEIKSALMLTAVQDALKEDGTTPADAFDAGSGSIRADRATTSTLVMDVTAADYYASANDPLHRVDLNHPSININPLPGFIKVSRTFRNPGSSTVKYKVNATFDDPTVDFDAFPGKFTLAAGASVTVDFNVRVFPDTLPGQHFGTIFISPDGPGARAAHIPVAFVTGQGDVAVSHDCTPDTIDVGESSNCTATVTNLAPVDTSIHEEVSGVNTTIVTVDNVSNPGVPDGKKGWHWDGTLDQASAPTVDAIEPGGLFGYLPLADFGVPPLDGVDDETLTLLGVDPYLFGSESYDLVSMVSNGYALAGFGDANDINYIPQPFPDAARPNNTLAGFWTDLNPSFGGSMYAAELTDGQDTWIVLEWAAVSTYSDPEDITYQIWITVGDTEFISYEYGPVNSDGDDSVGLQVGAENRDGTTGVELGAVPATNEAYHLLTSPPTPGGSVTITYDAVGEGVGLGKLNLKVDSDVVRGQTIVRTDVLVQ